VAIEFGMRGLDQVQECPLTASLPPFRRTCVISGSNPKPTFPTPSDPLRSGWQEAIARRVRRVQIFMFVFVCRDREGADVGAHWSGACFQRHVGAVGLPDIQSRVLHGEVALVVEIDRGPLSAARAGIARPRLGCRVLRRGPEAV
jgi:hypothetical protein